MSQVWCVYRHLRQVQPRPNGWACRLGLPLTRRVTSDYMRPSFNILTWWGPIPHEMGPSSALTRQASSEQVGPLLARQSPPLTRCGPGTGPFRLNEDPVYPEETQSLTTWGPLMTRCGPSDQAAPPSDQTRPPLNK